MKPTTNAASQSRVSYLGVDQGLMTDLVPLLEPKGVRLTAFAKAAELIQDASVRAPEVVLLDVAETSGGAGLAGFIADLGTGPRPHVICLASKERGEDNLEHRLAAMRAGVDGYLVAPVTARRLAGRILRMCGIIEVTRYRVLITAEDAATAKQIAVMLASVGMETLVVEDPLKILARMQAFRPNLILADLYLSAASGAELAAIIRDHDDFYGIPILFLSAETDLDKQLEALKAGGDGFIPKPVQRDSLIAAVEYRMRMSRWLQDRRTLVNRREVAHGFLPRDVFMRHLERLMRADDAPGEGAGLLIVDVDAHLTILEKLGLSGTEKLLRELELSISKYMTAEDSATRLDDFRYALLARREDSEQLSVLASRLRDQLSGLRPRERDRAKDLAVTVSVGVGLFNPPADDAFTLVSRAEKAVLSAKHSGGDRIHVWSPSATAGGTPEAESMVKRLVTTALAQNGLLLLFQPVLSLSRQEDELYEAQIRLKTMDGEQIPPGDFLSVAERAELMPRIDRWVLRRALDMMSAQRAAHPKLRLLVHQNVMTLDAPEWFPWLRDQLVKENLTRIYPVLEFQVADIRQHRTEAKPLIERLRNYGIQVCVANVEGHKEEVSLLGRLGVALAKLSFPAVRLLEQPRLMDTIQSLQARGIAVIAPGIDDQTTVSRVWTCRPDFIQGNYLQMPSEDLSFDFHRMSDDS